jgi:glycerophosphoryl diester phosphodiesterase
MTTPRAVSTAYRAAWRYLAPFTAIHLALRLLAAAVIVPLSGLVLSTALSASGETALTDQDIAGFLLTPVGFVGGLALAAFAIITAVLDLAVMTDTLRRKEHRPVRALASGLTLLLMRFGALFSFAIQLTLRVLVIAAPFIAVAGAVAWVSLGDYDINYYLTHQPPEFLITAAIGGALGLGLLIMLVTQLARWAVALHFVLFQGRPPGRGFRESASGLHDRRLAVIGRILTWALVRILAATLIASAAGLLIATASALFDANLRLVALATIAVLLFWWLADAVLAALANGALAVLLDRLYQDVSGDRPDATALGDKDQRTAWRLSVPALLVTAIAITTVGTYLTADLLEQLRAEREVEIIAHRGAAGTRPENTMAAVEKALADRADWVEIDVQETADAEVIVAHDSDFMKQAGVNLKVWDATQTDLAEIDIGSWFDPSYASERTPTLRDVLLAAKGRGKVLIELKYYGHDVALEDRVARIAEATGMAQEIAVMSLKRTGVEKMQQLRPEWPRGILAATAIGDLSSLDADFLALNTGQISIPLIRQAHDQGKRVYAWTVNEPVTMARLISMGVDGLITDEPALARQVMEIRNGLSGVERLMLWLSDQFDLERLRLSADASDA